ncbi:MAG: hypothetical protein JWM34_4915 [Ilumatobacteraceae bacterium]|nr:hypothetical protein [Ilumatobacteraceae bacterium]
MRIRFAAPDAVGLRVIEELPDLPLCQLEGKNGIGKTLSVRLLELASGRQPYLAMPHAWSSLRSQLGPTEILIDGLPEGQIALALTPGLWPPDPVSELGDKLGVVLIDGRPASWQRFRELVCVVRIAGDETLTETLAQELEQRAVSALQLAADVGPTVAAWDTELEELDRVTSNLTPVVLEDLTGRVDAAKEASRVAAEELAAARSKRATIATAAEALAGLLARRRNIEQLLTDLSSSTQALHSHEDALVEATRSLEVSASNATKSVGTAKDLRLWRNRHRLRVAALNRAELSERQILRLLKLSERPTTSELSQLEAATRAEGQTVRQALRDLDLVGNMRSLLQELMPPLTRAPTSVEDQPAIRTPHLLTVAQLRNGVDARVTDLRGMPRDGQVESLESDRLLIERRLILLARLRQHVTVVDRKADLVRDAADHLAALLVDSGAPEATRLAAARLASLQSDRVAHALAVVSAAQALAELLGAKAIDPRKLLPEDLGDSGSGDDELEVDEAAEDLDGDASWVELSETGPEPPDPYTETSGWRDLAQSLDAAAEAAVRNADSDGSLTEERLERLRDLEVTSSERCRTLERLADRAADEWTALDAELVGMHERLAMSIEALVAPSERWKAIGPGLQALMAGANSAESDATSAASIARVAEFTSRLRDLITEVRDGLNGVSAALDEHARRLSGRLGSTRSDGLVSAGNRRRGSLERVQKWAESELAEILGAKVLRDELFDSAARVSVDLQTATVSWSTNDGSARRRPLEAFSSGEQVFVYTRAKLDLLRADPPSSAHLIIVLDEFGAFVARDRFGQLLEFVADDALGRIAEQVVVMLPLSSEFEVGAALSRSDATTTTSTYAELAAQVAQRDYFAVSADFRVP